MNSKFFIACFSADVWVALLIKAKDLDEAVTVAGKLEQRMREEAGWTVKLRSTREIRELSSLDIHECYELKDFTE